MIWHYNCPECGRPIEIDWDWLKEEILCPSCNAPHYPPTPSENHFAYVGTDLWPKEMETAVIALRGTTCAAPGCFRNYTTLVHRRSPAAGGKTSVDNLVPLCEEHVREKGSREYDEWVATLSSGSPRQATAENARSESELPSWPAGAPPRPVTNSTLIASSAFSAVSTGGGIAVKAPFLRAGINRVIFDYDWRALAGTKARVVLAAWPAEQQIDPILIGTPEFEGQAQERIHAVDADSSGSSRLEVALPTTCYGRWTAAVAVIGDGIALGDYVLVGTD